MDTPAAWRSVLVAVALALWVAMAAVPASAVAAAPGGAAAARMPTAAELNGYLAAKGSPMVGQGAAFVASGGAHKVDPRLVVAIAGAESSFGQHLCGPFNAWGYGCPNRAFRFTSWADGIDTVTRGLRQNYLAEGRISVARIGAKYAPVGASNDPTNLNSAWVINVSRFLVELGGNPNNVDLSGVAGTLPVGPEPGAGATRPAYAWQAAGARKAAPPLVVGVDRPARVVLAVRNTGKAPWSGQQVRLRRIDDELRIASAPFAALSTANVPPGRTARFVIDLTASGTSNGQVTTMWRLEGPTGPFGQLVERPVRISLSELAVGGVTLKAPATIAAGARSAVIVKLRNAGTAPWSRDGDAAVRLGIKSASGPSLADPSWPSPQVPATLLEREVLPGEWGSFAFPVTAAGTPGSAVLVLGAYADGRWAEGTYARLAVEVTG